jgi:hypothetical protein
MSFIVGDIVSITMVVVERKGEKLSKKKNDNLLVHYCTYLDI